MRIRTFLLAVAALLLPLQVQAQLYRASFLQAAPGRLVELLEVLASGLSMYDTAGEARPYTMRHSQGDHWDILLLEPLGASMEAYYAPTRVARRADAESGRPGGAEGHARKLRELVSWREEQIVRGPSSDAVATTFRGNAFVHLEIFLALPGLYDELFKERKMENAFSAAIGRPENLIFTRESGAAWDMFTIGLYRDLKHYASGGTATPEGEEAAAKAAGFASRADIGPNLRRFISRHRDSLLGVVGTER
ncbi:MAG: hypothetical protein ABIZ91_13200 [Gemmatimonadaceae bacterium]